MGGVSMLEYSTRTIQVRVALIPTWENLLDTFVFPFEYWKLFIIKSGEYEYTWAVVKIHTFDNQFLIKFWLPTFLTIEILNPKVDTVPRKFE